MNSNKQIKILITGSSGMLGKDIFNELLQRGEYVFGIDLVKSKLLPDELQFIGDITNEKYLTEVLNKTKPDVIIHCAAIVDLNVCEKNKELAFDLHVNATKKLAQFQPEQTKLIYISTDSIFDGNKGNYSEGDIPNPINYYAKSKLEGEKAAWKNSNHIIVRTNIFGFNIPLKNSLAEWAIKNLINNYIINGFSDIKFNAIYTKQLSEIIANLILMDFKGTINIASENSISKYEFIIKIADLLGRSKNLVKKSVSDDFNFEVPRPKNTFLNVHKLRQLMPVPTIESGIINLIKDFNNINKMEKKSL